MTRRDYIAIAESFADVRPDEGDKAPDIARRAMWVTLRRAIAEVLQADNDRFDIDKFFDATEAD